MFVQLSHAKYHVLHPVSHPCGLNSQALLPMWRTCSYRLSWNVHMLTWRPDLGKIQRSDLQHWHSFTFSSYFHAGWICSFLFHPLLEQSSPDFTDWVSLPLDHTICPHIAVYSAWGPGSRRGFVQLQVQWKVFHRLPTICEHMISLRQHVVLKMY